MGRATAYERAEVLLRGYLSPEQLRDYLATHCFNVVGSDGCRYRVIHPSRDIFPVRNAAGLGLCAHPGEDLYRLGMYGLPIPDQMLAIKVVLENDAPYFKRRANGSVAPRWALRPRHYPRLNRRQRWKALLAYGPVAVRLSVLAAPFASLTYAAIQVF